MIATFHRLQICFEMKPREGETESEFWVRHGSLIQTLSRTAGATKPAVNRSEHRVGCHHELRLTIEHADKVTLVDLEPQLKNAIVGAGGRLMQGPWSPEAASIAEQADPVTELCESPKA